MKRMLFDTVEEGGQDACVFYNFHVGSVLLYEQPACIQSIIQLYDLF